VANITSSISRTEDGVRFGFADEAGNWVACNWTQEQLDAYVGSLLSFTDVRKPAHG
jgi:hypothetical protein